jgi:hypothetical protein
LKRALDEESHVVVSAVIDAVTQPLLARLDTLSAEGDQAYRLTQGVAKEVAVLRKVNEDLERRLAGVISQLQNMEHSCRNCNNGVISPGVRPEAFVRQPRRGEVVTEPVFFPDGSPEVDHHRVRRATSRATDDRKDRSSKSRDDRRDGKHRSDKVRKG